MVYKESFKVRSNDKACTFHNVTGQARDIVERSGVKNGIAVVYSHHTTCCVITQECAFDMSMTGLETLQQDLVDVFEAIVPTCRREGQYLHPGPKALKFAEEHGEDARGCHNTDAHLRSSIVGRSETIVIDGVEYHMKDCDFPTVDPARPAALTPGERDVLDKLCQSFMQSEKLERHVRFLYAKGSLYRIENNNLLFHGAVPLDENGEFARVEYGGETFSGRAWMDKCERTARQGYFAPVGSDARRRGRDFLYYLWCGPLSPIFGRDRMASFEHLFVDGEFPERKNPYYAYIENEDEAVARGTARRIFAEFGLDFETGHIVNGHIPVRAASGEQPVKAGGKLIVIDGGFCKAYHQRTGIAGYTLVSSSRGLSLRSHGPFESTQKAILDNLDILSTKDVFEPSGKRVYVEDTDEGARLKDQIADLKKLLAAYADGSVKEQA